MPDVKNLSKVKINNEVYSLKDAQARADIQSANEEIAKKQNIIDASNKLAAEYVSLTKPEDSKLTSTDVQNAVYELENAIEAGGTGSVVTVEKLESAEAGYIATYIVKQGGEKVGASINIPKDYLVKSAEIKEVAEADVPYAGAKVGDKYIDFVINSKEGSGEESHLYLAVNELVDVYKADETSLTLGANNVFSVKAVEMGKVTGLEARLTGIDTAISNEQERAEGVEALKEDKANLKALAYKDSATGTVASQTIAGVAVTGDLAVDTTGAFGSASTAATLTKADYAPAGTVAVQLKDADAATQAEITRADYVPAGSVSAVFAKDDKDGVAISGSISAPEISVTPTTASVRNVKSLGELPSFVEGAFTPASLTKSDVTVATEGIVAAIDADDEECLVFSAASTKTASNVTEFSGGEKASDTWAAGSLPTLDTAFNVMTGATASSTAPIFSGDKFNVSATFAGATEAGLKVANVSYVKPVVDSATFTGTAVKDALVTGVSYDKTTVDASKISVAIAESGLKTADIVVAAKDVTVE